MDGCMSSMDTKMHGVHGILFSKKNKLQVVKVIRHSLDGATLGATQVVDNKLRPPFVKIEELHLPSVNIEKKVLNFSQREMKDHCYKLEHELRRRAMTKPFTVCLLKHKMWAAISTAISNLQFSQLLNNFNYAENTLLMKPQR